MNSKKIRQYLLLASESAVRGDDKEVERHYRIGALGIRADGATVLSYNIPVRTPHYAAHAEFRICKKLDVGSTVFVARIDADGGLKGARPCRSCVRAMIARGVKRCFYSIAQNEFGVMEF